MRIVFRGRDPVGFKPRRWQHARHEPQGLDCAIPAGQGPGDDGEIGTHLAVAALLVEVLRADYDVGPAERQQVVNSVATLLDLQPAATQALVEEAERQIDRSHDLYQFTSQINRSFSEAEKVRLLEALWRVADADSAIHKYEEHLIRRVADLLHVPHAGFIAAKLRATGAQPGT
jgi:uncharacterized tellurite resistance protein B-like protein